MAMSGENAKGGEGGDGEGETGGRINGRVIRKMGFRVGPVRNIFLY